jgi:group I intron endonuclease
VNAISGVYQITCLVNGKRYIGSSVNVRERLGIHRSALKHGKHINPKLQAVWNKHGAGEFVFEILEEADSERLMAVEQAWLESGRPELNINPNADAPMRGKTWSAEHKAKISAWLMGHKVSAEQRAATTKRNLGNKYALGVIRSDEFKARLRARMTPELKRKLLQSRLDKKIAKSTK